jgi:hypothetical protein
MCVYICRDNTPVFWTDLSPEKDESRRGYACLKRDDGEYYIYYILYIREREREREQKPRHAPERPGAKTRETLG